MKPPPVRKSHFPLNGGGGGVMSATARLPVSTKVAIPSRLSSFLSRAMSVTSWKCELCYGGALNHANPGSNGLLAGATFPALGFLRFEVPVHGIVADPTEYRLLPRWVRPRS